MNKKPDPRIVRTKKLLIDALYELIREKRISSITIRDIVQKAKVNRSTFYLHFQDKQEILEVMQDFIWEELEEAVKSPRYSFEEAMDNYNKLNKPIHSTTMIFEHIQKHSAIYQVLLYEEEFRTHVIQVISRESLRFHHNSWEATFTANGVVGIIQRWLENGMKESIDEMSLWLTKIFLFPLGSK